MLSTPLSKDIVRLLGRSSLELKRRRFSVPICPIFADGIQCRCLVPQEFLHGPLILSCHGEVGGKVMSEIMQWLCDFRNLSATNDLIGPGCGFGLVALLDLIN